MTDGYQTLDLGEAAEFLKVSETTAREMASAGELPGAKIGRAWVFLTDDLIDWLRVQVKHQRAERVSYAVVDADVPVPSHATRKTRRRNRPKLPQLPC